MIGYGDSMQVVGPLGNAKEMYSYFIGAMGAAYGVTSDFYWANEDLSPAEVSFDRADGIAIDNGNSFDFNLVNAGEVIASDITVAAQPNLNWLGNPFSADISIQDVKLTDELGMVGYGDSMQIVGPLGNAKEMYSYFIGAMGAAYGVTTDFYWANEDLSPADKTLKPGDGFAIDNGNSFVFDITIKCPYSL